LGLITLLPGADALRDHYLLMEAFGWFYYALPPMAAFFAPRLRSNLVAALLMLRLSQPPVASALGTFRVHSRHPVMVVEFTISPHADFD